LACGIISAAHGSVDGLPGNRAGGQFGKGLAVMKYRCACGHKVIVPDDVLGRRVRCSHCNGVTRVSESDLVNDEPEAAPRSRPTGEVWGLPAWLWAFFALSAVAIAVCVCLIVSRVRAPAPLLTDATAPIGVTEPAARPATRPAVAAAVSDSAKPKPPAVTPAMFVAQTQPAAPPAPASMSPKELFAFASPMVGEITGRLENGDMIGGSGFVIDDSGLLATNFHVIDGCTTAMVHLDGVQSAITGVVAVDREADLAIVQIHRKGLHHLTLDGSRPDVGSPIVVIGSPEGYSNTLSLGTISGLRDEGDEIFRGIQVNAAISHGSSGSPVIESDGRVVGIIKSMDPNGQNLNFAVRASDLVKLLKHAGKPQSLVDAWQTGAPPDPGKLLASAIVALDKGDIAGTAKILTQIPDPSDNGGYWYVRGLMELRQQKYSDAAESLGKSVHLIDDDPEPQLAYGVALEDVGKVDDADRAFHVAAKLAPTSPRPWVMLGQMESEDVNQTDAAIASFNKAKSLDPNNGDADYGLGQIYDRVGGDFDKAVAYLQTAVRELPNDPDCRLELAQCYFRDDKIEPGVALLRQIIDIDPNCASGKKAKHFLDRYRQGLAPDPDNLAD
jgi:S1-C subfamily serine protease/Flp pilus assembly protein TadD